MGWWSQAIARMSSSRAKQPLPSAVVVVMVKTVKQRKEWSLLKVHGNFLGLFFCKHCMNSVLFSFISL